jgi:hypothetical protein
MKGVGEEGVPQRRLEIRAGGDASGLLAGERPRRFCSRAAQRERNSESERAASAATYKRTRIKRATTRFRGRGRHRARPRPPRTGGFHVGARRRLRQILASPKAARVQLRRSSARARARSRKRAAITSRRGAMWRPWRPWRPRPPWPPPGAASRVAGAKSRRQRRQSPVSWPVAAPGDGLRAGVVGSS